MKRNKIRYDRWLRTLFLSFALLTGGGVGMVWGQIEAEKPTIILVWDDEKHNNVHTEEKITYVVPNKSRVLSIPELNINNRNNGDNTYNWFVHWYVKSKNKNSQGTIKHHLISVTKTKASDRGGWIAKPNGADDMYTTHDYFVKAQNTDGLVWSNRLKENKVTPKQKNGNLEDTNAYSYGLGIDASTIAYTLPTGYNGGDTVYCDVSVYQDGVYPCEPSENNIKKYLEPTLLKRYKYIIKKAEDCPSYNKKNTTFYIDFPSKALAINLSMPYSPDNYFWIDSDNKVHQGAKFQYRINKKGENAGFKDFKLTTKDAELDLQQTQRIIIDTELTENEKGKDFTVEVLAICNEDTPHASEVIATFVFHPIENAEFKLENELTKGENDDRWPRGNTKKYREIGIVDFDQNRATTTISQNDNMSDQPLGAFSESQTSYGFIYKDGESLLENNTCYTSYPGMYGLFRSANKNNISKHNEICANWNNNTRKYKWITPYIAGHSSFNYSTKIYQDKILYDRTYEITRNTQEPKYGYFYYIDATDEPGTLVSIPIKGTICGNTELTVTGWLADMTRPGRANETGNPLPLAPNLNIILKGVNSENEEVVLHRFTTGDALTDYKKDNNNSQNADIATSEGRKDAFNMNLMQWQQIHYKFVISEELYNQCTPGSFRLEVQNNEPHTDGADYAIDDIRIFKTIPDIKVVQSGNPCDEKIKTVKFKTNYKMLLRNFGLTEGQPIDPNIAISLSFDEYSELPDEHALKKYFKDKNEREIKEALQYFTTIYYAIYNAKEEDGEIKPNGSPISIAYNGQEPSDYRTSYVSTRIDDMVWTDESASSATRKPDDDYITSTNVSINEELTANKTYIARVSKTSISGECDVCSFFNSFVLEGVGDRIEVTQNGTAVDITKKLTEGEYTITGILKYNPDPNSDELIPVDGPKFDWFLGTWDEFVKPGTITANGKSYSIMEALQAAYHYDGEDQDKAIENELKKLVHTDDNPDRKLILGETSFEFTMTNQKHWGVMFPRAKQDNLPNGAVICSDPHEFLLGGTPPTIEPGDPDVPDPEDPDPDDPKDPDPKDPEEPDKPKPDENPFDGSHVRSVRVGLVQIQDMQQHNGTLRIPIHVRTSLNKEKFAKQEGKNKSDIIVYKTSDETWNSSTEVVATLETLVDNDQKADWNTNYFTVKFTPKAKEFKEGFWYMVGIPYKVINTDNDNDVYVDRVFMLTLKIVPEYVTWVGSAENMHNWNNDGPKHWRRSNNEELYMPDASRKSAETNGIHPQAYTPMRFTKVTIYGKAKYESNSYSTDGKAYAAYPHLYQLNKQTTETSGLTNLLDMAPVDMDTEIGAATKNIEYDLLADPDYEKELWGARPTGELTLKEHDYACVRFYGNTCDEIYIKPESEILHTEYLTYNKAHVDYEMDPNRWYMLASPLKGVVSGDMYLPTGSNVGKYARQETPAFGEINYDNTNYTRWQPAVYMRGWNKASAIVVRPSTGTGSNNQVDYGIKGSWSNLYNDVEVPFTPGTGFSIGTKAGNFNDNVLFRLPKADNKYIYYDSATGNGNETRLTSRDGNGRFYFSDRDKDGKESTEQLPVTFTYDESKGMIGNPFMSHLNMKEFFKQNQSLGNTYYIMGESATETVLLGDKYTLTTNDSYDGNFLAPLQSFIVEGEATQATFTTDMIAKAPTTGNVGLRSATVAPAEEPLPHLRITATRNGVRNTAVVAGLATASDSYVEGEDAALLINEEVAAPQVYTLAGNQMVAINVTPDLAEIPVGIHGKDATPVELSFKLSGAMKNVKLVDKQTGKRYDVTDGLTLTVPGNTYGRYFLNGSIATSNEIIALNHIIFYNSAPGRIDVSSVDALREVTVCDISGRALRTLRNLNTPTASVDHLAPGIYVVRAESGSQTVSEKVEVK